MKCLAMMMILAALPAAATAQPQAPSLHDMMITVTPDHPREYIFTDKGAAHIAGEAVGENTRSYHGFYIAMHEVVDGWLLRTEGGVEVGPATVVSADVYPDRLVRHHQLPSGETITETVELFDVEHGFRVTYDGVPPGRFAVVPRVDMRFLWRVGKPGYEVRWDGGVLRMCRQDRLSEAPDPALPRWLAIAVRGAAGFTPDGRHVDFTHPKGVARKAMANTSPYLPGAIEGHIPGRMPYGKVEVVFTADVSDEAATERVRRLRQDAPRLLGERYQRLQALVTDNLITTGVARDDKALAWTRISLDNLIMNQRGWGIYAGFYWFTTYWGRDTFITLPGACIVQGDFDTAETLLKSFSEFQERDPASKRLGRLPNFVTVEQVQYASIDGTWWFVRALDELMRQSGREELAREMAPVVFAAVAGAAQYAVDDMCFIKHGDGETWMDAGGEEHPYSPRGDRAVEVQALWHRGLLTAAGLAQQFPDITCPSQKAAGEELADRYLNLAEKLHGNFQQHFWQDDRLVDHLDIDGTPDHQIRPNGLLAVLASPTLFTAEQREAITTLAAEKVVRPWGVLSLTEDDPFFHPKHLDLETYYYDEAYHNGDLWLWLSGAYVSALNSPADGFGQTRMLLDEALDEGAVGTIQEIRDGAKAASNDEFGGATSQAWTLAELLRNVVQDYAGLKVNLKVSPAEIILAPDLPADWPELTVRTRIGEHPALVVCTRDGDLVRTRLLLTGEKPADMTFALRDASGRSQSGQLEPADQEGWNWQVVW